MMKKTIPNTIKEIKSRKTIEIEIEKNMDDEFTIYAAVIDMAFIDQINAYFKAAT